MVTWTNSPPDGVTMCVCVVVECLSVTERETKWVEFRGQRQAQVPLDPCSRSSREASFRRDPTTGDVACYPHCPPKKGDVNNATTQKFYEKNGKLK